jgi:F-type H+-transporting ATPase subunit delta
MMSTDIRLRENYANTLFELAGENQAIDAVKEDLETIAGILKGQDDLVKFLTSPYFSRQCKEQLVVTALSARIAELTMNFLMVLIKHNRVGLLPEIIFRYGQLWDADRGCYPVKVTVSRPLEQGEAEKLTTDIGAAVGGTVRLELAVNPDILGGAIVRCGDKVIDNSVHNRLRTAVKTIISQVKGRK